MSFEGRSFEIGHHTIGAAERLFVIAEIGLNHGGSLERALTLVDAAAAAGATAVKLQTVEAAALVSTDAPAPAHVNARSMVEFFSQFELDEAAHRAVVARARERGLAVVATPLSEASVDLLERIGIDAFKIASGDLTWPGLITRAARTRRPMVISTGMADLHEVARAISWAREGGAAGVALLHTVSAYPTPIGSENLRAIGTLGRTFGLPVGLSDHGADGFSLPLAVALGASIYERHLMLHDNDQVVDAPVSSTPTALAALVRAAERTHAALGSGQKTCARAERANRIPSRRALYATRALSAGHRVQAGDVIALRPGAGLPADREVDLIGRVLPRDLPAGAPFLEGDLIVRDAEAARVA
ncbi:MAG TPA: N-acetylneuraminate synthase family protein [Vicinamibacterales bacterium]|nr:N-acetylneuraminate synthase family protein [Vicinamibacterales bacterium]